MDTETPISEEPCVGPHCGYNFEDPIQRVTKGSVMVVESLLSLLFEGPAVYKYNDESGQYEEYNPRAETKYDLPFRMF